MRQRFNQGDYLARAMDDDDGGVHLGEIVDVGPAPSDHPGCRSQMVEYLDEWDRTIVHAHQYGRPNGVPAQGTLPDPKFLFENGVRYQYASELDSA